jgi:peptidoglycan biosynthesis protein MviN/MurJ (putative lipid II flippase)
MAYGYADLPLIIEIVSPSIHGLEATHSSQVKYYIKALLTYTIQITLTTNFVAILNSKARYM